MGDISGEVVSLASFVFRGYCSVNDFPKKNHDKTEFRKCSLYLREVITKQIINKLRGFFSLQPIEKAWVFGSCSRGEETKDSDIDILVRFDSHARITLFKYAGMVEALSQLLHRKVDLVEEGQLKDFAVSSVDRDKILVYEREA